MSIGEERFQRIEDKVDDLKQDVTEIKSEMRHHVKVVQEHITGDKKIIKDWKPVVELVPELKEIIHNHKFEKELSKRRNKLLMTIATIVGIAAGASRVLGLF